MRRERLKSEAMKKKLDQGKSAQKIYVNFGQTATATFWMGNEEFSQTLSNFIGVLRFPHRCVILYFIEYKMKIRANQI